MLPLRCFRVILSLSVHHLKSSSASRLCCLGIRALTRAGKCQALRPGNRHPHESRARPEPRRALKGWMPCRATSRSSALISGNPSWQSKAYFSIGKPTFLQLNHWENGSPASGKCHLREAELERPRAFSGVSRLPRTRSIPMCMWSASRTSALPRPPRPSPPDPSHPAGSESLVHLAVLEGGPRSTAVTKDRFGECALSGYKMKKKSRP